MTFQNFSFINFHIVLINNLRTQAMLCLDSMLEKESWILIELVRCE